MICNWRLLIRACLCFAMMLEPRARIHESAENWKINLNRGAKTRRQPVHNQPAFQIGVKEAQTHGVALERYTRA